MTIYTRCMMKRFLAPLAFGLAIFAILIFLGDTFDKMNHIVKSSASLWTILECLWLGVPYWAVRVIPMATLLATLVAMSGFVQSGEWLATQACGLETRRFWLPILWTSLAVALVAFAAQETVMPAAWARSRRLWREKVHPEPEYSMYSDVAVAVDDKLFIRTLLLRPKEGLMERPLLESVGENGVYSQLDARSATWDDAARRWVFQGGVERAFTAEGVVEQPFQSKVSDLDAPPADLIPRPVNPDEMSLREVLSYSHRVGRFGGSPREYEVAAQSKIAYPFANVVICALGIPISLRLRKSSRVASFCMALGVSFAYLWCMEVGRAMGVGGSVPPWAAAWMANAGFGAVAFVLIRRWDL
ncbi:MAG: hypothetical protein A2V88_11800 [Elusimicrobia bacterium RBG_16_66_12]|nr:MAG: hypothetical protein A2V88_11800 [Elusimicrobia bacterium RBG_16_66_12]